MGGKTCTRRSIEPRLLVARTSCSGMLALWAKTLAWSMWFAPKGGVKITVRYVKHGVSKNVKLGLETRVEIDYD